MDIKFEIKNNTGLIILNRPKSLNALNLKMAQDFALKLDEWKIIYKHFTHEPLISVRESKLIQEKL